ncbi:SPFH domain-containing protein [Pseudobacteriovorax antillogorgiicola]|uniref:SPFH domain, Band 7 family protein n=1 Tax=Pseudobacteriovorax antillogorgiicola TaxID=1513793 RepID=A0A1Y6C4L5_9BACT|nr:stomatin-like protein [Pseudobacteriovorax antillogorgiicola]TCS49851.1 SPFH domain-containing protein [Pseudobacteriovorax antillogorgiicola]SMF43716.1 SPFH domain, Band 7 family protein [Pseudobacteriovorax antillogorgiicola]
MELLDIINLVFWGVLFLVLALKLVSSIKLVPTRSAFIVERLGRYNRTLGPGFHALIPFLDKVPFKVDLKEEAIEVPPQECFSKDEVHVTVDGVIYLSVMDPAKASYGVTDYRYAAVQLAQTTTRAVIGTLDLDRTFEERDTISARVVQVLEQAGESWGIRVHRYEIKNLRPPESVRVSMEKQVTAERDRRAILAKSEGDKQAKINRSEGRKKEMINLSEGTKQQLINEAEGRAAEILALAMATADSIKKIGDVVAEPGGSEALKLQLAERYVEHMQGLAKDKTRIIIPADLTKADSWLSNMGVDIRS